MLMVVTAEPGVPSAAVSFDSHKLAERDNKAQESASTGGARFGSDSGGEFSSGEMEREAMHCQ